MKKNNVWRKLLMVSLFLLMSLYAGQMPVHAAAYGTGGVAIYDDSIERNKSDVAKLKQLIKQQNDGGSFMPDDLEAYGWVEIKGEYRLIRIETFQAVGKISLAFPYLRTFSCLDGAVTGLDVTKCPRLEELYCDNNRLTSLNVTKNKKLSYLSCSGNKISKLNVTKCPKLQSLDCSNNNLKTLNLIYSKKLADLDILKNKIEKINVSNCKSSIDISCDSSVKIIGG